MKKLSALAIAFILPFALAACDDNGTTGVTAAGTFNATISGDFNDSLDGTAFFGEVTDTDTGDVGWVLWLSTTESQTTGKTIYFVREGNRPGTGTITLVDFDMFEAVGGTGALYIDMTGGEMGALIASTGGSLTITQSSSDRMQGSFNFQGSGTHMTTGEPVEGEVTITGEFDARSGSAFHPGF